MKGGLTVSELSFHSLVGDRVKFGLMDVLAFMPGKLDTYNGPAGGT
ncbi:hypothetical protein AI2795V1_4731 (plasmid) [Serratia marcescens]|nr:hypothetical protein AI2795V1_4731 [Serratia marcescens]CAH3931747.1 hypothetical protein AI2795V1_4731 [Serratia marcescens]